MLTNRSNTKTSKAIKWGGDFSGKAGDKIPQFKATFILVLDKESRFENRIAG